MELNPSSVLGAELKRCGQSFDSERVLIRERSELPMMLGCNFR